MRKQIIAVVVLMLFAASAYAQTPSAPTLRIVTEDPNLPSELFYGSTRVKPVRLRPGTNQPITIGDADFFVQQHYIDFLGRFPDAPGFAHWSREITDCGGDAACIDRKRVNTSGAFFLSGEFLNTGYFVYRVHKGALGQMPLYAEFMPEARSLARGIVVNNGLSVDATEANKTAFLNAFVSRGEFQTKYGSLSNADYVRVLTATAGVTPNEAERLALVNGLNNNTETRASVLRKVVDGGRTNFDGQPAWSNSYSKALYDREFNPAFVLMEYFGYLRRDPDTAGYQFWLAKLQQFNGNFTDAQMVRAFIVSAEYRNRF